MYEETRRMDKKMTQEIINCELCGEPMPEGETMFKFHGYSGPCPKPPIQKQIQPVEKELQAVRDAFQRIEASLRTHLQDTWHSTYKAEDDLNLVRQALTEYEKLLSGEVVVVPKEPTPRIMAAAALGAWRIADPRDIELATEATKIILMESNEMALAPGASLADCALAISTMAESYRHMVRAAAPQTKGEVK